ncbi:putative cyclase-domain-containing protein [Collybia nuda]|uniref:Cyclase-domain-containing protein n=1 Tax=Collybia nuda TaxID=64659 RepID=A0A9P5Y226_9AGAR|nr:putative cyclase-domain-containing protein [Collybia nuda]
MTSKRLSRVLSHFLPAKSTPAATTSTEKAAAAASPAPAATTTKALPTFDELPHFKNFPGCAWSVWGENDELGTVNLLTDEVVQRASREEIRTGKAVSLNWALNFPDKPMFGRKSPEVHMKVREPTRITRDDEIHMNTQSGTQWDGLRHFGIVEHGVFYNNTPKDSLPMGIVSMPDPHDIDPSLKKIGIQNWADHGICGRGVLLDLVNYHTKGGTVPLPYDPWTTHGITVPELEACAKHQGVEFRQGDILLLRVGFTQRYNAATVPEREALAIEPETLAGIEQSDDMKRFLWNNHFAAIASDQPALERWPIAEGTVHMHQTILGLWGMPIGEFFDLEKLSKTCAETGRYTFFFSSWPLNIIGGCASPPNAAVSYGFK